MRFFFPRMCFDFDDVCGRSYDIDTCVTKSITVKITHYDILEHTSLRIKWIHVVNAWYRFSLFFLTQGICTDKNGLFIAVLWDVIYIIAWASYQIRKIAGHACAGNAGNVFPRRRLQRKPLVSDPGMHHGTWVTCVPWCLSGSLTCGGGENVPGIPGACATCIFTYLARGACIVLQWMATFWGRVL